ncbi:MAG: cell division protein FtsQ/DivIB [Lonepinella koalarum]|nr:cell division protein FtsQ/DivIB [Lonepinella koalarum]
MAAIKRPLLSQKKTTFQVKKWIKIKPLLALLFCGVLFYAYSQWEKWLEKLDQKPISAFALLGSPQYTTNNDIRDIILKMGELKGFFGQDVDIIRQQIESMPWIKGAVVRKIWPDRLSIWVAEHTPVAYWNENEFLTSEGIIFKLPLEKLKETKLPRLFGPDYQSVAVLAAWQDLFKEFKAKNMNLKAVSVDQRESWGVLLDNNIELKLGRGEWKSKIERFAIIYPQIDVPENKKIDYIDLRYQRGGAVSFVDLN